MAKAKFNPGDRVVFNGYSEDVAEEDRLLTEGEVYEVAEVNAKESTLAVQIDNADFNPKKKESEDNPRTLIVDVFFDEVSMAADEDPEADAEAEEDAKPARTKTAAKPAAKGRATAKEEPEEDPEAEDEDDAKPAAKGKTVAKAAAKPAAKAKAAAKPAEKKGKAKAKPAKEEPEEVDESETLPALEAEDAEVAEMVNDAEDILALAEELVESSAALDYKLGGVLYHVRLGGAYKEVDPAYAVKGGWQKYIEDKLPTLGYRKAMHLIDIYYKFNLHNIDAAKVQELGWTKCSKIAAVMDGENAEELVELAEKSTVTELSESIKESFKEVGGTKGEKRRKVAFKFRLWDDQAAGVEEVLAAVQAEMGFKDVSDAFEHVVMEWAAEHPITKKTAKTAATSKAAPAKAAPAAAKGKVTAKAR